MNSLINCDPPYDFDAKGDSTLTTHLKQEKLVLDIMRNVTGDNRKSTSSKMISSSTAEVQMAFSYQCRNDEDKTPYVGCLLSKPR